MLGALAALAWWVHRGCPMPDRSDGERGRERSGDGYSRAAWAHWVDQDDDCQDTRQEVLIAQSEIPVTFRGPRRCKVARGRWRCPYTGSVFTDPHDLDVDHLVPLADAHRSGGRHWDAAKRRAYANDLRDPDHLIAVASSANRQKGSKSPERWLPSDDRYHCAYASAWGRIKHRWSLSMTRAEQATVDRLRQRCPAKP